MHGSCHTFSYLCPVRGRSLPYSSITPGPPYFFSPQNWFELARYPLIRPSISLEKPRNGREFPSPALVISPTSFIDVVLHCLCEPGTGDVKHAFD
jgi:hypothetical protein